MIKKDNVIVVVDYKTAFKVLSCCVSNNCIGCPFFEFSCQGLPDAILNQLQENCSCDYLKLEKE